MSREEKFLLDDLVRLRSDYPGLDNERTALVARAWYEEDPDEVEMTYDGDPTNRVLYEGEYGITLAPSRRRLLVKEQDLELLDRTFALGQLCKLRNGFSPMSGVVTKVDRFIEVEHVMTGQRIPTQIPAGEVRPASCIDSGDHVTFGNWIGIVIDTFIEGLLQTEWSPAPLRFGRLEQHFELGPMHDWRTAVSPIPVPWTQSSFEDAKPRVYHLRKTVVYIDWIAINPKLSSEEQERCPKPKKYWTDLKELTSLRQEYNRLYLLNDTVVFKTHELRERYGLEPMDIGPNLPPLEAMKVVSTSSQVHVCWQDGSETAHNGSNLVLHTELDENDAYRGEHVLFVDADGSEKGAVVSSIDPIERIAEVLPYGKFHEPPVIMSVLDLKTAGAPGFPSGLPRGHVVLTAPNINAFSPPQVSRIGAPESDNDHDDDPDGKKLEEMGLALQEETPYDFSSLENRPRLAEDADEIDWYGHVTDLRLDGRAIIRFPNRRETSEDLSNIAILQDGLAEAEALMDMLDSDSEMFEDEEDTPWTTEDGNEIAGEDWEDVGESGDGVHEIVLNDEDLEVVKPAIVTARSVEEDEKEKDSAAAQIDNYEGPCKIFEVLEEAPSDHAYLDSTSLVGAPSKKFLSRLHREYKILQSSLPDDILVRTYEDRTDLFRVLIIGTAGTPYEDAPFCIDVQLLPTYPDEPPKAHYHSWTEGHGRISPNLYEDGNICLSVLGTWAGEASESWDSTKSTLLQVFVSIQGLVLVSEPYYTEPGFERQKDTDSGKLQSRHYSERAYVLSRRAVLHALKHHVRSFEREVRKIYFDEGRLKRIVDRADALIRDANSPKTGQSSAQDKTTPLPATAWGYGGKMTKGSALSLQRIVDGLRGLQEASTRQ